MALSYLQSEGKIEKYCSQHDYETTDKRAEIAYNECWLEYRKFSKIFTDIEIADLFEAAHNAGI